MHYLTSVRSRWLDIKEVLFCVFIDEDAVEVDKNAKKQPRPMYSHFGQ